MIKKPADAEWGGAGLWLTLHSLLHLHQLTGDSEAAIIFYESNYCGWSLTHRHPWITQTPLDRLQLTLLGPLYLLVTHSYSFIFKCSSVILSNWHI